MVSMAVCTYLIVFNLDHLVQSGRSKYKAVQVKIIKQIKDKLDGDIWKQRAKNFERFEPDRRDVKPSEWYILLAAVLLLYKRVMSIFKREFIRVKCLMRSLNPRESCARQADLSRAQLPGAIRSEATESDANPRIETSTNDVTRGPDLHSDPKPIGELDQISSLAVKGKRQKSQETEKDALVVIEGETPFKEAAMRGNEDHLSMQVDQDQDQEQASLPMDMPSDSIGLAASHPNSTPINSSDEDKEMNTAEYI